MDKVNKIIINGDVKLVRDWLMLTFMNAVSVAIQDIKNNKKNKIKTDLWGQITMNDFLNNYFKQKLKV